LSWGRPEWFGSFHACQYRTRLSYRFAAAAAKAAN